MTTIGPVGGLDPPSSGSASGAGGATTQIPSGRGRTTGADPVFDRALATAMRSTGPTAISPSRSANAPTDPTSQPSVGIEVMLRAFANGNEHTAMALSGTGGGTPDASQVSNGAPGALDGGSHPVLTAGERYLGTPYVWGGADASVGFDCSGFVQQAYADLGVDLPRVSADQARAGTPVDGLDQARPGDLVYWNGDGTRPNHIGIYAGDGEMLVAPSTGDVVRYQQITREPHAVRRILA